MYAEIKFCAPLNSICIPLWVTTVEIFIEIPFGSINMLIVCVVILLFVLAVCGCVNAGILLQVGMLVYLNDCHYSAASVF